MADMIEKKLLKDIESHKGKFDTGEEFSRNFAGHPGWIIDGKWIIDTRLTIAENKLQQHGETKKHIISLINKLLPKYVEDGADEFAGQLEFAILGDKE